MGDVLIGLFWLWLGISLVVYGLRLYRRLTRPRPSSPTPTPAPTPPEPEMRAPASPEPAASTATPEPAPAAPEAPVPPDPAQSAPAVTAEQAGPVQSSPPSPPSPALPVPPGPPSARASVAELVAGIEMPCGLVPVVVDLDHHDGRRVLFRTGDADPQTVISALTDELRRLGFETGEPTPTALPDSNGVDVHARRDRHLLVVSVLTRSGDSPTVAPGDVVVVLAT